MILLLGSVNCGNHRASSCTRCPQGNGRLWCNGECKWYGVWGCGPNRLRNEKSTESKNYSLYDWLFSTNSSPSAEAKGKLNHIKPGRGGWEGHCVLKWVLRGHFLGIKMPQWNWNLSSFLSNFSCFLIPLPTPSWSVPYKQFY